MKKVVITLFFLCNAVLVFSQSTSSGCGSCDVKPGQIDKFKSALEDSKLHFYTDEGKTKLDLKKADKECNSDYFTTCNNKMVLISSGKKKDRTEIRQNKKLKLNDYSKLYFDGSFANTPKDNLRKGVTIAQIHNSAEGVKRPLLRVEIAGGIAIKSVFTSSYLKGQGDVDNDFLVPFKDGDEIECTVIIKGSGNKVSVEVYNKTRDMRKKVTYKVGNLWQEKDGEFYFKAGAYTQVSGPKTIVMYDEFKFYY